MPWNAVSAAAVRVIGLLTAERTATECGECGRHRSGRERTLRRDRQKASPPERERQLCRAWQKFRCGPGAGSRQQPHEVAGLLIPTPPDLDPEDHQAAPPSLAELGIGAELAACSPGEGRPALARHVGRGRAVLAQRGHDRRVHCYLRATPKWKIAPLDRRNGARFPAARCSSRMRARP